MPVQYNVSMLVQEPVGSVRRYSVDGDVRIDGERRHIRGEATFLRTQDGVLVTAELAGVGSEQCSRCLGDVTIPIEMTISEEYIATVDANTGAALKPPVDLEAFRIDEKYTLNLEEAVRQSWAGALPMQPLCRQDCQGLCLRCGQDLNSGDCSCPPEMDERWSALQTLAQKVKGT